VSEYPWTPGPWQVIGSSVTNHCPSWSIGSPTSDVAAVWMDPDGTEPESVAEALAPELAEVVMALRDAFTDKGTDDDVDEAWRLMDEMAEKLQAIIKESAS
jgi:hypothetical protein